MRCLLLLLPCLLLSAQTPPVKKVADKKAPAPVAVKNFKESGSPNAPITFELYTDYQCPACRDFYLNTLPSLINDYVNTGKVRLIHRDFPLQQHQYSRMATRYANAAGEIGKYDIVAKQLFQTQPEWAEKGDIDTVLSKVLSPADLAKIRAVATSNDTAIDQTVLTDVAMGNRDGLNQTPTLVIVAKGKREVIGGPVPYNILKSYLDSKLPR